MLCCLSFLFLTNLRQEQLCLWREERQTKGGDRAISSLIPVVSDHQQQLVASCTSKEEGLLKPEVLRSPGEWSSQNQLSRAHRGSQRLKWQSWSLRRSVLGCLYICYSCWLDVLRSPDSGNISDPFACSWASFPPTGLPYPALMSGFVFGRCLVLLYLVLCSVDIPGWPALF